MPSNRPRAGAGDDLKRIAGIGPAVARKLEAAGIRTYADIAGSTPAALAELVAGVAGTSAARIEEMDWIGQAQRLRDAPRVAAPGARPKEREPLVRVTRLEGSAADAGVVVVQLGLLSGKGVTEALDCLVELTARTEGAGDMHVARFTVRVHPGHPHSIGAGGIPLPPGRYTLAASISAFAADRAGEGEPLWEGTAHGGSIEVTGDSG